MKRGVFIFLIMLALGSSRNCQAQTQAQAQTWTFEQDSLITVCTGNSTSCTYGVGNILPTQPGTVWVVYIHTPNNVTISSVTGGGGSWTLCPASSCHIFNAALGANIDMAYNLSGSGGTTAVTVNLSGNPGAFWGGNFVEIRPPLGSTPSFDASGTTGSSTCTTCPGVGLTLTATDAVIQMLGGNGAVSINSWSAPYINDYEGNGINLAATSGAAPTVTSLQGPGAVIAAIAFKSTAGTFSPPPLPISIVNFNNLTGVNCTPSCSLSIPSTGSGHLLFIQAGNLYSNFISSINGGGTWVIPTGANTCSINLSGGSALSCGYVLSSTPGVTSLNVTMTGSANTSFAVYELATSAGSFLFDTQGSATNSPSFDPSGVALKLSGTNDAIFQAISVPGGTSAVTYYPLPYSINFFNNNAGQAALLNTSNGAAPRWADEQNNTTAVTGVAFKISGTGTAPAPPTGLNAVVH